MSTSSASFESAEDMETGGAATVKDEHMLNPPPGEAAAQVVAQVKALQQQLKIERRQFSTRFGKSGEDIRPLVAIRENLSKDNETYLKLAEGQAKVAETELTSFQISLSGKNADLLGYLEALDPNYEYNTKEKVDSTLQAMKTRHVAYEERITEALGMLADLQRRVRERNVAERRTEQQQAPVISSYEAPRFVAREGAPGKLADSVDPGNLSKWIAVFQDWMVASYGGGPRNRRPTPRPGQADA